MDHIIVPVDFSPISNNAAFFAIAMAKDLRCPLVTLFHSYHGQDRPDEAMEKLYQACQERCQGTPTVVISVLSEERIVSGIARLGSHEGQNCAVMGITGGGGIGKKIVGSNTLKVAQSTDLPILILHEGLTYKAPEQIGLGIELNKTFVQDLPMQTLRYLCDAFPCKLHIINIDTDSGKRPLSAEEFQAMHEVYDSFDLNRTEFHFDNGRSVLKGISEICEDEHIELLILMAKDKTFVEKWFNKSVIKQLAYRSRIPILILHLGKKQ